MKLSGNLSMNNRFFNIYNKKQWENEYIGQLKLLYKN